jgi:antitoxin component of MazEF toxin-antitoxin module
MQISKPIIIKTWKGNGNGSILATIPNKIAKQYDLEEPSRLVLEQHSDGIFLKKLDLSKGDIKD